MIKLKTSQLQGAVKKGMKVAKVAMKTARKSKTKNYAGAHRQKLAHNIKKSEKRAFRKQVHEVYDKTKLPKSSRTREEYLSSVKGLFIDRTIERVKDIFPDWPEEWSDVMRTAMSVYDAETLDRKLKHSFSSLRSVFYESGNIGDLMANDDEIGSIGYDGAKKFFVSVCDAFGLDAGAYIDLQELSDLEGY